MHSDVDSFSTLLLHLENDLGTRDTCRTFLSSMRTTLPITRFKNTEDLQKQLKDFYDLFIHLRPRMAIIQNYLDDVMYDLLSQKPSTIDACIAHIIRTLDAAEKDDKDRNRILIKEAVKLIQPKSKVLIHSHSHTVLDVLDAAHAARISFDVVVAEQDAAKTMDIIYFLREHDISFTVVPEYMLSHVEDDISCMLLGAVTLKHDMNFAVDAGSKAIVSQMNTAKVPVYLLLTTNKFSYWRTKQADQVVKTEHSPHHARGGFSYERVKFSHDRLPIDLVTKVITDEGSFTVSELKTTYEKKLKEYEKQAEGFEKKGVAVEG